MKYYCVFHKKIISEVIYFNCRKCGNTNENWCETQKIVGVQVNKDFESNMNKLIRESKLNRITNEKFS